MSGQVASGVARSLADDASLRPGRMPTAFMGRIISIAVNGDVDPLIDVDGQYTGRAA
jgi:hypothetical protein